MSKIDSDALFDSHSINDDQAFRISRIRLKAKELATAIIESTVEYPFQSHSISCIKEATMYANLCISLEGKIK